MIRLFQFTNSALDILITEFWMIYYIALALNIMVSPNFYTVVEIITPIKHDINEFYNDLSKLYLYQVYLFIKNARISQE